VVSLAVQHRLMRTDRKVGACEITSPKAQFNDTLYLVYGWKKLLCNNSTNLMLKKTHGTRRGVQMSPVILTTFIQQAVKGQSFIEDFLPDIGTCTSPINGSPFRYQKEYSLCSLWWKVGCRLVLVSPGSIVCWPWDYLNSLSTTTVTLH
jgi:hypothetical protein